jgi:hypothetical protein
MAFETSSFQDGQWTTRTLDVNAVLQQYDNEEREAKMPHMHVENAPVLGLLTQTVIRSPLVHWILPVRLRNQENNDVAFIGVRSFSPRVPFICSFSHFTPRTFWNHTH